MNEIAVSLGSQVVYWSSVLIVLAVAACFLLTYALFTSHGGRAAAMWLLLPLAVVLSVLLSRFLHWFLFPRFFATAGDFATL